MTLEQDIENWMKEYIYDFIYDDNIVDVDNLVLECYETIDGDTSIPPLIYWQIASDVVNWFEENID